MASPAILAIRVVSDAKSGQAGLDATTSRLDKVRRASSAAGKVFAVGMGAAVVAGARFAQAAAEDAKGAANLALALRNNAHASDATIASTERWIGAQGRALGVSDDQLRPALARLVGVTHNVGKAQRLAGLAMDISAGTGKDLRTVTDALAKAQTGSLGGLSRLGAQVKDSTGKTRSLNAITKDLARTYKGAASTAANTTAGRQQRLKVRMDELQESIGYGLLPVLEKLTVAGLHVVDWVDKNRKAAGVLLGTLAGLVAAVASVNVAMRVWTAIQAVASAATAVQTSTLGTWLGVKVLELQAWAGSAVAAGRDAIAKGASTVATLAQSAATKAAAAAQWAFNVAMSANPVGLVVLAVVALIAGFVILYKRSATFRAVVLAVMHAAGAAVGAVVGEVVKLARWVGGIATAAWRRFGPAAVNVLRAVTTPTRLLIAAVVLVVRWVAARLPAAFRVFKAAAGLAWRLATTPARLLIAAASLVVRWIASRLVAAFVKWRSMATGAWHAVVAGAQLLIGKVTSVVSAVREKLGGAFGALRDRALGPLNAIRDAIGSVVGKIQSAVSWVGSLIDKLSHVHMPHLSNPFGRLVTVGQTATAGARAAGGDTYLVTVQTLDTDGAARAIETLLARKGMRRAGTIRVGA